MAMVKCKECKQDVSNKAKVCPHCGVKEPGVNLLAGAVLIVVLVAVGWAYFTFSSFDDQAITQEQFGKDWPFTVSDGSVDCVDGIGAVFKSGGVSYQLNGIADAIGYAAIETIWRDSPDIPGTKIGLGSVLELALDECK